MRSRLLSAGLVGLAWAAAGAAQVAPAPGQPAPGQPSSEGTNNPYNSRENEVRDWESDANYRSRAVRDRAGGAATGKGRSAAAAPADIVIGKEVRDRKGKVVGLVEAVDADGAVVSTGPARVKVPLDAFGKSAKGLMIGITKAEFDTLVASATGTPTG